MRRRELTCIERIGHTGAGFARTTRSPLRLALLVFCLSIAAAIPAGAQINGTMSCQIGRTAIGDPTGLDVICQIQDPNGIEWVFVYDASGLREAMYGPLGCVPTAEIRVGLSHIKPPGDHGHQVTTSCGFGESERLKDL